MEKNLREGSVLTAEHLPHRQRSPRASPPPIIINAAPQKKKGSCLKTILIVFGVIFILGLIGGIAGSGGGSSKSETTDAEPAKAVEDETKIESEETTEEETEEETKTEFYLGEGAEYKDVQIIMTNVSESEGGSYNRPAEGNIFVLVEFEIANNSKDELIISSLMSFDAYQDGYATALSISALIDKEGQQLDGTIAPGKKMKGWVGYEVPADYQELEIDAQLSVFSNKKIPFIYKKQ